LSYRKICIVTVHPKKEPLSLGHQRRPKILRFSLNLPKKCHPMPWEGGAGYRGAGRTERNFMQNFPDLKSAQCHPITVSN